MVVEAYEVSGLTPIRAEFCSYPIGAGNRRPCAGCAITALYDRANPTITSYSASMVRCWADKQWGILYVGSFISGFDGDRAQYVHPAFSHMAWLDGVAAAQAVFEEEVEA